MRGRRAIALAAGMALGGCVRGMAGYPGYSGPYRSYSPPYYRDYDAPYYSWYYGPSWGRDGLTSGEARDLARDRVREERRDEQERKALRKKHDREWNDAAN